MRRKLGDNLSRDFRVHAWHLCVDADVRIVDVDLTTAAEVTDVLVIDLSEGRRGEHRASGESAAEEAGQAPSGDLGRRLRDKGIRILLRHRFGESGEAISLGHGLLSGRHHRKVAGVRSIDALVVICLLGREGSRDRGVLINECVRLFRANNSWVKGEGV